MVPDHVHVCPNTSAIHIVVVVRNVWLIMTVHPTEHVWTTNVKILAQGFAVKMLNVKLPNIRQVVHAWKVIRAIPLVLVMNHLHHRVRIVNPSRYALISIIHFAHILSQQNKIFNRAYHRPVDRIVSVAKSTIMLYALVCQISLARHRIVALNV